MEVEPGEAIVNISWIDDGAHPTFQREAILKRCMRFCPPLIVRHRQANRTLRRL